MNSTAVNLVDGEPSRADIPQWRGRLLATGVRGRIQDPPDCTPQPPITARIPERSFEAGSGTCARSINDTERIRNGPKTISFKTSHLSADVRFNIEEPDITR